MSKSVPVILYELFNHYVEAAAEVSIMTWSLIGVAALIAGFLFFCGLPKRA